MTKNDKNIYHLLQLRYGIIGSSVVMQEAIARLAQVAPTDLSVLITGETGTGKEVFANAIHNMSNRKKQSFISVNCGAIPETLLESELFGHEKGAFTGATEQRKGYFEVAHNGTIFLDEIGEMPVGTQVKLLRVLETGEFNRLGSTQVHKVDVRLIAATNRDLEYEVRRGNFREDLYFRLNAVQIHLPPLRKHPEDIALLVEFFANRICERNGFFFEGVTDEALSILEQHPWRGNIRELRNLVETLVTIEQGGTIDEEQVRRYLKPERFNEPVFVQNNTTALVHVPGPTLPPPSELNLGLVYQTLLQLQQDTNAIKQAFAVMVEKLATMQMNVANQQTTQDDDDGIVWDKNDFRLEEMERKFIVASLRRFEGNRRSAAKALGISERTLYRKLIEYKLTEIV
ncbi:MAG: sigma-54-dependent Fis family transcriptional regulator [Candidatus Kapabacteria bacterium]|nr:sigma-54-dependent Fis family transcriptional regulator [Candidatus Kapabacteria bacterium]MBX7155934.1 sigma-54 dependent transcriptional regulator [Bacteroidota bacterium]